MKVFVVYCHPSRTSFTYQVYLQFMRGLQAAGHTVVVSDIYEMGVTSDMTGDEY